MYDDGNPRSLKEFTRDALGHERFTSIDCVENDGLDVTGGLSLGQMGKLQDLLPVSSNTRRQNQAARYRTSELVTGLTLRSSRTSILEGSTHAHFEDHPGRLLGVERLPLAWALDQWTCCPSDFACDEMLPLSMADGNGHKYVVRCLQSGVFD